MQKEFDEKREIDIKVNRTVCDICGDVTKEGDAIIRIQVKREEPHDPRNVYIQGAGYSHQYLDICSADCLAKNINGITLVLNTKIIPSITKNEMTISLGSGSVTGTTISNAFAGSILPTTGTNTAQWQSATVGNTVTVTSS
jgi:hypothetical protein